MAEPGTVCAEDGCDRTDLTRGYCGKHYQKRIKNGTLPRIQTPRGGKKPPCSVDGCDRDAVVKGMCKLHYNRARANTLPLTAPIQRQPAPVVLVVGPARADGQGGYAWPLGGTHDPEPGHAPLLTGYAREDLAARHIDPDRMEWRLRTDRNGNPWLTARPRAATAGTSNIDRAREAFRAMEARAGVAS